MNAAAQDGLLYGQNWEDSSVDAEALEIGPDDRVIAIAGAGCTVLELLSKGPLSLDAVDRNAAQIHLTRLKLASACRLPADQAAGFLGGIAGSGRISTLEELAPHLDPETAAYWRGRSDLVARGIISQGRVEKFFALVRRLLGLVHSRDRIEELFRQTTLDAQRQFFRERWNTAGWRALFLLAHKRVLDRVLDPAFYQYVDGRHFSRDLLVRAGRCLTELPIRDNYFLSWILRGRYGDSESARPGYLRSVVAQSIRLHENRLRTHRSDLLVHLRSMPDSSVDKLYLSNVGEWLSQGDLEPFFGEVGRVARDGAVLCYRALMADRAIPAALAHRFVEDPARSASLAARDRAFINVGFHRAVVRKNR